MPICIWSSVVRPITDRLSVGASIAMRGSLAAAVTRASSDRLMPGRDDPAFVGAGIIDHVEGGGGAEIDDDQVALVERVGGDRVEHPVGADRSAARRRRARSPIRPAPCPATSGSTPKYLAASTSRLWSARGTTVPMITASTSALGEAFELEQLVEPDRILVGGAPRIGGDPPAGADHAVLDQGEDEVGVAGVDGEQHRRSTAVTRACL